jgi:thioredoxin
MRVAEIRGELKERKIDFSDCFDKESLVMRLQDARDGTIQSRTSGDNGTSSDPQKDPTPSSKSPKVTSEQTEEMLKEIRAMSVRDLKGELASRQIRWGGLLEKEDLVQALVKARVSAAEFSVSGLLNPGQVGELTGNDLQKELSGTTTTPLLLDVYATWCGPCKLVAPQVESVAASMGDRLRVAKMDSDKENEASGNLRVKGLPTLILFGKNGQEIDRVEGALMKDQMLEWIESKL